MDVNRCPSLTLFEVALFVHSVPIYFRNSVIY